MSDTELPRGRVAPGHLPARESEAYLQLIKDLNVVLAQEWQTQPETKIRRGISEAIADSLRIYI
jgi:hypothetical protein